MKGRSEAQVQAGILAYLQMRGDVFFWRQNTVGGLAQSGAFLHAEKGVPDILVVLRGRLHGLEVKREIGGKVSADQERFGNNLVAAGGVYAVVRNIDEVATALGPVGPKVVKFAPVRRYPR